MAERTSPMDDLDLSDFKPGPVRTEKSVTTEQVLALSESMGFPNRQPRPAAEVVQEPITVIPAWKKPGRKKGDRNIQWSFRVTPSVNDKLTKIHEHSGLAKSEIIERAMIEYHTKYFGVAGGE
jgi:hypothetical protein